MKRPSPAPTPLLIIGAHKAGTTSLYEMLATHPQVHAPADKELGFFTLGRHTSSRAIDRYSSRWHDAPPDTNVWLDGSTSYGQTIKFPGVADRIRSALGPKVRIVFMARDPLKRMASGHAQLRSEWLRAVPVDPLEQIDALVEPTLYRTHINEYQRVFGADNVFVGSLEELAATPHQLVARLQYFAGIDAIALEPIASNVGNDKVMPPAAWHQSRMLRPILAAGNKMPPTARTIGGNILRSLTTAVGEAPATATLTWNDLGDWAARVHNEAETVHRMLPLTTPPWPSLSQYAPVTTQYQRSEVDGTRAPGVGVQV